MQGDILAIFKNRPFNAIINGAFDYWQRGTNVNALSAYGPDRFFGNSASGFFSRFDQNDAFAGAALQAIGFDYGVYSEQTVGGGVISQRIESLMMEMFDVGEKVTLSFYAASASVNATGVMVSLLTANVKDDFSSTTRLELNAGGGTANDFAIYLGDLLDRSVAFTRYTYTFTITEAMKRGLAIEILGDTRVAGQAGFLSHINAITGVMLNSGNKPPKFYRAGGNKIGELQLCQRYFQKTYNIDVPVGATGSVGAVGAFRQRALDNLAQGKVHFNWKFPVVMRSVPVCNTYSWGTGNSDSMNADGGGDIVAGISKQSQSGFYTESVTALVNGTWYEAQMVADAEL